MERGNIVFFLYRFCGTRFLGNDLSNALACTGLTENKCCLGCLPPVADVQSTVVWTKAALGGRAAQLYSEPYKWALICGAHYFGLNLRPDMFTGTAEATFIHTVICIQLADL